MEKQYYISKEQYLAVKAAWKTVADSGNIAPADIVIYNMLRSKPTITGFVECKNPRKIQGNDPWRAFKEAKMQAKRDTCTINPWEKYRGTASWSSTCIREDEAIKNRIARFKTRFGIDLPADLWDRINGGL